MISSTRHVASHFAITGILSVYFFRDAVVRPALSGRDGKVSARVVVSTCMSTLILVEAAHRTASKLLSGEIGMPSTGGNLTDTVPTAPDCPARIRYQDTPSRRPLRKSALLGPFQRPFLSFLSSQPTSSSPVLDSPPCYITITDLPISLSPVLSESAPDITITDLPISSTPVPESTTPCDITTIDFPIPSSPVLPSTPANITMIDFSTSSTHVSSSTPSDITMIDLSTSSTQVFPPTPHIITIIDLPDLANCNRLSLTSDTTLIARDDDDDLEDIFADEASNTKEVESSGDERTFHEVKERSPARAMHGYRVDILPPSTTRDKFRLLEKSAASIIEIRSSPDPETFRNIGRLVASRELCMMSGCEGIMYDDEGQALIIHNGSCLMNHYYALGCHEQVVRSIQLESSTYELWTRS